MWLESFDKRKSYARDHYTLCAVSYPATETAECAFLNGFMVLVFFFFLNSELRLCVLLLLYLKAGYGNFVPITEPALLKRCAWESHPINCTALVTSHLVGYPRDLKSPFKFWALAPESSLLEQMRKSIINGLYDRCHFKDVWWALFACKRLFLQFLFYTEKIQVVPTW